MHHMIKLICMFGMLILILKVHELLLWQTFEASRVFEHLVSLGVKPNAMSYSLLVDAHLTNRDQKAAISVIDEMVSSFFAYE